MNCVTKRPKLKKRCDNVGHFVGFFVFSIALGCALFTLYMNTDAYRGDHVEINCANASVVPNKTADPPEMCKLDMGAALRTFGWARLTSFLVRALGLESGPASMARARGCTPEHSWCHRLRPKPLPPRPARRAAAGLYHGRPHHHVHVQTLSQDPVQERRDGQPRGR